MPSIESLIDIHLRKKLESSRRNRDCWHVSEIMQCLRGVYLQRKGAEPEHDSRSLRIFEMGHKIEELMVNSLGEHLVETQIPVIYPQFDLVGSADAIIQDENGYRGIECKSQHSKAFWWMAKEGMNAKPEHVVQSALYWSQLREKYQGLRWCVVYFSKDDLCIKEIPLLNLEEAADLGFQRVKILQDAWKSGIPPEPESSIQEVDGKWKINWKAKYCSVHHACTGDPDWESKAELEVKRLNTQSCKPESLLKQN